MGTFHDNLGPLHGITVVVERTDGRTCIGRCHEATERHVMLLDADEHTDGERGLTSREYLERAARWGVFKSHDRLVVPGVEVKRITPLGQLAM